MLNFVTEIESFTTFCTCAYTFHQKHQFIPPQMLENTTFITLEHCMADASLLHALVEYNISATFPVQEFHAGTRTIHKNIYTPVGWGHGIATYHATQRINSLTEVHSTRADHKLVAFT